MIKNYKTKLSRAKTTKNRIKTCNSINERGKNDINVKKQKIKSIQKMQINKFKNNKIKKEILHLKNLNREYGKYR